MSIAMGLHREATCHINRGPFRRGIAHSCKCHWFVEILQMHLLAVLDSLVICLEFAVLYLIHYPKIQQKMRQELDDVCGDSRPSLAHRSRYVIYCRNETKE